MMQGRGLGQDKWVSKPALLQNTKWRFRAEKSQDLNVAIRTPIMCKDNISS